MNLEITRLASGSDGEGVQGPQLVQHVIGDARRIHFDEAAAESAEVAVSDLGAYGDVAAGGDVARGAHDVRVRGVKSASEVGIGHHLQQGRVVGDSPRPVALSNLGVERDHPSAHRECLRSSSIDQSESPARCHTFAWRANSCITSYDAARSCCKTKTLVTRDGPRYEQRCEPALVRRPTPAAADDSTSKRGSPP